jgi:hypothetical protein
MQPVSLLEQFAGLAFTTLAGVAAYLLAKMFWPCRQVAETPSRGSIAKAWNPQTKADIGLLYSLRKKKKYGKK